MCSSFQISLNHIQQSSVVSLDPVTLGMKRVFGARVSVAIVGYEKCRLMPPVEYEHHQYVPDLMAGAQVVQLTWKITLWNFGHVEDDSSYSKYIHYQHSGNKFLDYVWAETPTEPDPMKGGDEAISRHTTEYKRAKLLPLLDQVMRVYLGEEHCQHHGQNGYQVHLPPVPRVNVIWWGTGVTEWVHEHGHLLWAGADFCRILGHNKPALPICGENHVEQCGQKRWCSANSKWE